MRGDGRDTAMTWAGLEVLEGELPAGLAGPLIGIQSGTYRRHEVSSPGGAPLLGHPQAHPARR